jgi:Fe-S oxidoreductase
MKHLASLCFNCKQCELECPSNVNIPRLMIEAKAAYVTANGLKRADWILSRAHSLGAVGSTMAFLSNWMIRHPTARWVMEKLLGISRHRKLPLFARRSFLRSLRSESTLGESKAHNRPVVYFVGDYANYYDPELSQAFVAILRHNDIPVIVPRDQTSSGMAMISAGDLDAARDVALTNLRVLGDYAREGIPIVCTEPSAALCLKQEYPALLEHPDVQLVADQTVEAGTYLAGLHARGKLKTDFSSLDLDAGYHTPCHLKSLSGESPLARLLALIPDLRLHTIDKGCSGMAGAYGLTSENFQTSLKLGWDLISRMRDGDLTIGTTECASCKIQMEQGTTIPTLHPLKLMAYSYGLMPNIANKLQKTTRKLIVS